MAPRDVPDAPVPAAARPAPLVAAVVVVAVEAFVLAAGGAALAVGVVAGRAQDVGRTLAVATFLGLLAALLGFAAGALARRRGWARGPVVTWQVLQLVLGVSQVGGSPVLGGVLAVLALAVLVLLFLPATLRTVSSGPSRRA